MYTLNHCVISPAPYILLSSIWYSLSSIFFFVDKLMKTVISQSLLKFELDSLKEILSSVLDTFKFAFAK